MSHQNVECFYLMTNGSRYNYCKTCSKATTKAKYRPVGGRNKPINEDRPSTPPIIHNRSRYVGHRCRCEICVEANRQYSKAQSKGHEDTRREYRKRYYAENKQAQALRCQKWYQANRERALESDRRYRKTEQGKLRRARQDMKRRQLKHASKGHCTTTQLRARWDYYGGCCYLCGKQATAIDHVTPLTRGGSSWPANLRPACKPCNSAKHNKTLPEYIQFRQKTAS